jgi:biotin transporter BioY
MGSYGGNTSESTKLITAVTSAVSIVMIVFGCFWLATCFNNATPEKRDPKLPYYGILMFGNFDYLVVYLLLSLFVAIAQFTMFLTAANIRCGGRRRF